jgi:hypothetical protein
VTETPNETPNGDYFCITRYSLLGRPPLYLPGAGAPGDLAVGSTPDALFAGPHDAKDSTEWHNRVPARSLLSFSWRRLVRRAAAIRCPILPSGLTHGRIPPCSACRRYTALRPIPTCRHASLCLPRREKLPVQRLALHDALATSPSHHDTLRNRGCCDDYWNPCTKRSRSTRAPTHRALAWPTRRHRHPRPGP